MKKLNKVAMLFASATIALSAASAFAQSNEDNWLNFDRELVWKNGDSTLCWRDNYWTPATANAECDGATVEQKIIEEEKEKQIGSEKMTFSADAFFDFDKATLKPAGKQALDELAYYIGTLDALEMVVAVGHTDSIGADAYNMKLSLRRAEAVKAYLVNKGIPADAIYVEGKGETMPVATNKTKEGRAQNRRVEIEVTGSKAVEK